MKPTMNSGGQLQTAILRSAYLAAGSGLLTFFITWGATDALKAPIIAGCVSALSALGFRGIGEGSFDRKRDNAGDTRQSDVTPNP